MKKSTNINTFKKGITFLLSAVLFLSSFAVTGCGDYYPDYDLPDDTGKVTSSKTNNTEPVEQKETVSSGSFNEQGQFEFNPEAINQFYANEIKSKPEQVELAKIILRAVYNLEATIELTDEYEKEDFDQALRLARFSNPMLSCVDFVSEDYKSIELLYYPPSEADIVLDETTPTEEVGKEFREFEAFVTETINNNISSEDSKTEQAKKIYSVLVNECELDYEAEKEFNLFVNNGQDFISCNNPDIIDVTNTHKLPFWSYLGLYQFFLTQLDIEYICVLGAGPYQETEYEKINEYTHEIEFAWFWTIITDGANSYNTDILMEKILLDSQRESNPSRESDLIFFGMSDETRKKTFNFVNRKYVMTMNPLAQVDKQVEFPACKTDYK